MNRSEVPNSRSERRDQIEHLGLDGRVQRGGRLVEDQQRRLRRERHRDHHPLEHPAGQLVGISVHHPRRIGDPDLVEHLLGAVERLRLRSAGELEHLGHLAPDLERGVQRPAGLLVDHRHRALAELAQLGCVHREHVAAVDLDLSAGDVPVPREVTDDPERDRRFAAARLSDEPERLAPSNPERDVAHHARSTSADAIGDLQVLDVERVCLWTSVVPSDGVGGRAHPSSAPCTESEIREIDTTSVATATASNSTSHQ